MSSGASSWSFREEDFKKIQVILAAFLRESTAKTSLIVDRTGQLVATVGENPAFDAVADSFDAAFDYDAVQVRATARISFGFANPAGICRIFDTA